MPQQGVERETSGFIGIGYCEATQLLVEREAGTQICNLHTNVCSTDMYLVFLDKCVHVSPEK